MNAILLILGITLLVIPTIFTIFMLYYREDKVKYHSINVLPWGDIVENVKKHIYEFWNDSNQAISETADNVLSIFFKNTLRLKRINKNYMGVIVSIVVLGLVNAYSVMLLLLIVLIGLSRHIYNISGINNNREMYVKDKRTEKMIYVHFSNTHYIGTCTGMDLITIFQYTVIKDIGHMVILTINKFTLERNLLIDDLTGISENEKSQEIQNRYEQLKKSEEKFSDLKI